MPAFEDDLRLTREARKRTLEQVQQETRIPVDVLRRFEAGDLARDSTYNEVYLKAFLRSYARAVGVPQAAAVAAYEADRQGAYRGELHPDFDPATAPPAPTPPPPIALEPPVGASASAPTAPSAPPVVPPPSAARTPDAALASASSVAASPVAALRDGPKAPVVGERVARPAVKGARRSYDKNWASIIGLTVAVVAALAAALWFLVFRDAAAPDDALVTATGVAARIDSAGVGAGAASGGPQFQLPLAVSVAAAGDGLQSFRVSENADRRPYWIDSGSRRTFTSDSSLTFWGEDPDGNFAEATLELQGIRWTPPSGRPVVINAATGQRLLDSLSTVRPAPAP